MVAALGAAAGCALRRCISKRGMAEFRRVPAEIPSNATPAGRYKEGADWHYFGWRQHCWAAI
jgi:hypothetical protein